VGAEKELTRDAEEATIVTYPHPGITVKKTKVTYMEHEQDVFCIPIGE